MTTTQIPHPTWQLLVQGTIADLYVVEKDSGELIVAKVLRELSDECRRAFTREFRVLEAQVHVGVIPILGGDLDGARPHYFMPFLRGGTLTRLAGTLDGPTLLNVARWLAEVVAALHASNLQHGDLKPDNIFLTDDGQVQVADPLGNGSRCTVSIGTKWGGTPGYWAPEVASGGPISRAGDVFSLGATLFHLATGRAPDDGMNLDPAAYNASVPKRLRKAIVAMCRLDPVSRPSMQKVAEFLSEETQRPNPPASKEPETPGWLKVLLGFGAVAATAALANRATKSWDPNVGRYRDSDGTFRGNGLFD